MARERTGSLKRRKNGKLYAVVTWTDENTGKRRFIERLVEDEAKGRTLIQKELTKIKKHGTKIIEGEKMTFYDLARRYKETYLVPPKYDAKGHKYAGLRSLPSMRSHFNAIKEHFGRKRLHSITYGDLIQFKIKRMETNTIRGKQRSAASVHRELACLKKIFNYAVQEGWLSQNPFAKGESLIIETAETKRERIITREEEERLLSACSVAKCKHLRAIIIAALDLGCRQGELLRMRWKEVDLKNRIVIIPICNTKTLRQRELGLTTRLTAELEILWQQSEKDTDSLVFGVSNNVKHAFSTVRKVAGLNDLRFHDLRHSVATRLIEGGLSLEEAGAILGHNEPKTTKRYVNLKLPTARRAANVLDNLQASVASNNGN